MNIITPNAPVTAPYKVGNFDRGSHSGALNSQWRSRPDDQRFLSMAELRASVARRAEIAWTAPLATQDLHVITDREDHDRLALATRDGREMTPTNWAFSQLCREVGAPAGHYARLPGPIAGIPLQYLMSTNRTELAKFYGVSEESGDELRAVTSPTYGRVMDVEVVDAIMSVIDDTWKVPGVLNWGNMHYDPNHPISKDTTTLYASDRDVFVMLVRDQYPVEVGKLPDGSPDLMFPGFIVSNSEVGSRSITGEFMWIRGLCCNRTIWGAEGHRAFRIIHRENAPLHFERARVEQMYAFTQQSSTKLVEAVNAARSVTVASDKAEAIEFFTKLDFSRKVTEQILDQFLLEEGKPVQSAWDAVNAITARARSIPHTDDRLEVERKAGRLLARASA